MHAIFFATKRAFHGGLRITRPRFQSVARGMTGARFDMMYALTRSIPGPHKFSNARYVLQSDLRKILGVTAPVVSRMLRSLEALGWVTRERCLHGDRRQRKVSLTKEGLKYFRKAHKRVSRFCARVVTRALCWGRGRWILPVEVQSP